MPRHSNFFHKFSCTWWCTSVSLYLECFIYVCALSTIQNTSEENLESGTTAGMKNRCLLQIVQAIEYVTEYDEHKRQ